MTTLTTYARIDKAAHDHYWEVKQASSFARTGKVWFSRDGQNVMVRFSTSGAVVQVKYGLFGAKEITGTGKADQVIELLSKEG